MPTAETEEDAKKKVKDLERESGEEWYYRRSPWGRGYVIQRKPRRT